MLKIYNIFILLVLAGCSSGPLIKGFILDIESDQLPDYWVQRADVNDTRVTFTHLDGVCRKLAEAPIYGDEPSVTYSFFIDSEGKVFRRAFLEKSSTAAVDLNVLNESVQSMDSLDSVQYAPAPKNIQKSPVRVKSKLYINKSPGQCGIAANSK